MWRLVHKFKQKNYSNIKIGKLLVNPKRPCITGIPMKTYSFQGESYEYRLPEIFNGWDIFIAQVNSPLSV
jgi:hypothetical protein